VSRALPSWYLANHPTHNVLACSHSMHLAEQFSRWNRGDVGTHGRTLKLELSTDDASVGRWSVTAGGTYRASGVGTAIMGFRADLGIIDDPAGSAEDAFSELNRGKLWDWFVTSFVTRLKPGAKVKGKTVAELGNRNRPIDMIVYQKGGKDYLLLANSSRGVMKINADEIAGWKAHLEAKKIAIESEFEWPQGGRSIYIRDPSGNSIEFAEPRIWGL